MNDNTLAWRQLTFAAPNQYLDILEEIFWLNDVLAITLADAGDTPLLEPAPNEMPLWPDTLIIGLFAADFDPTTLLSQLANCPFPTTLYADDHIVDREWTTEWQKHYQPIEFEQLRISPSEWPESFDDNKPTLYLDPGLAFGAGTHPTTKLCLQWLSDIGVDDQYVMDYGCGSGILALAAAKLGAKQVIAIDYDPQAVTATQMNAEKNQLKHKIVAQDTQIPPLSTSPGQQPVDVLVANILAKPLIELAPTFVRLIRPGGKIALAGLLTEQTETVLAHYEQLFTMQTNVTEAGWQLLTGIRNDNVA